MHALLRYYLCFFFFSSRRRHTRCSRDWSSDVCSSDLNDFAWFRLAEIYLIKAEAELAGGTGSSTPLALLRLVRAPAFPGGGTPCAATSAPALPERRFRVNHHGEARPGFVRHRPVDRLRAL